MKDDVISRHGVSAWLDNMGYPKLADAIMDEKRFPPVQPEPHWIPCRERLPEEPGVYTVTNNNYEVVRYVFSGSYTSREYWERCVKAWLPLPKPYVED